MHGNWQLLRTCPPMCHGRGSMTVKLALLALAALLRCPNPHKQRSIAVCMASGQSAELRSDPRRCTSTQRQHFKHSSVRPTAAGPNMPFGMAVKPVPRRVAVAMPLPLVLNLLCGKPSVAAAVTASPGSLAILGAGGKTGRLCVEMLRSAGQPVLALGRAELDVVKASVEEIADAVRGADAVIFACSASSKGGNAVQVDEQAAIKAAQACKLAGVPKYVLISSGGVARPGSLGYVATNWMPGPTWGIMDAKAKGEEGAKAALRGSKTRYTVLRPGGLEDTKYLGPTEMELNQGDVVGGLVSRADVAAAAVAAARSSDTDDVTFELYAHSAFAQGPGSVDGFGGAPVGKTGYERRGGTWPELFRGLKQEVSKI